MEGVLAPAGKVVEQRAMPELDSEQPRAGAGAPQQREHLPKLRPWPTVSSDELRQHTKLTFRVAIIESTNDDDCLLGREGRR